MEQQDKKLLERLSEIEKIALKEDAELSAKEKQNACTSDDWRIPPEQEKERVLKYITSYINGRLTKTNSKHSAHLLQMLYYPFDSRDDIRYSRDIEEQVVNMVIEDFPDMSGMTLEEKANLYADWRHSGHICDCYSYSYQKHDSCNHLLNSQNMDLAIKLGNFLAEKAIEVEGKENAKNSVARVLEGFMDYSYDHLCEKGFDSPIILPEKLRNPLFCSSVIESWISPTDNGGNGYRYKVSKEQLSAFTNSTTLREYFENCIALDTEKKGFIYPLPQKVWEKIFKKYPWPELEKHIIPLDTELAFQQVKEYEKRRKEDAIGEVNGIFVDVDETLIRDGHLNRPLYNFMCYFSEGIPVNIFTGGNIESQKQRLKTHGVDIKRFPVFSKEKYRNYLFTGLIIDDIRPEVQGFILKSKRCYLRPDFNDEHFREYIKNKEIPNERLLSKMRSELQMEEEVPKGGNLERLKKVCYGPRYDSRKELFKRLYELRYVEEKPEQALELAVEFHQDKPVQTSALLKLNQKTKNTR